MGLCGTKQEQNDSKVDGKKQPINKQPKSSSQKKQPKNYGEDPATWGPNN